MKGMQIRGAVGSDVVHAYRGSALSSVPAAIVVLPQMSFRQELVAFCQECWRFTESMGLILYRDVRARASVVALDVALSPPYGGSSICPRGRPPT